MYIGASRVTALATFALATILLFPALRAGSVDHQHHPSRHSVLARRRHDVTHGSRDEGKVTQAADAVSVPDDGPRGDKDARGDPRPRERERSKREEQRDAREETHLRLDQRRAEEPGGRLGVIRGRGDHRDHARACEHRESAFNPAFLSGFLRHPPGTLVLHCRHGSAGDGSISVDQTL